MHFRQVVEACNHSMRLILALCVCVSCALTISTEKPHIVLFLVDDWGWSNVGMHAPAGSEREVLTPNIDAIVSEGIELTRAYAYRFCSPSRSSLNSGRLPVHVNMENALPTVWNPKDPEGGFAGIPRNMTGLGTVMKAGGYSTAQIGKWDAGMATYDHTPHGRGYDFSLGYFHHDNDYWNEQAGSCDQKKVMITDLWHAFTNESGDAHEHGAFGLNGSSYIHNTTAHVPAVNGSVADYEDYKLAETTVRLIRKWREGDAPLFINHDFHIVHEPLQVPFEYYSKFLFMEDDYLEHRRIYASMVHFMDAAVGNITAELKANNMWDNSIVIGWSDNGGPTFTGSSHTANNWPHKGSKGDNWEGGVRVNAYVGGGALPKAVRGTRKAGMAHITDIYATAAALAGVDPTDHRAATAGLPPIDALNMWPYWSGDAPSSPRDTVHHDPGAFTMGDLKILTGDVAGDCWTGPRYPNGTVDPACNSTRSCGTTGCLYNVTADPTEHIDLADDPAYAGDKASLLAALAKANLTLYTPKRGNSSKEACVQALSKHKGYWGPFVP